MTSRFRWQDGHVPRMRTALAAAEQMGCTVETIKRTGEVRVVPPPEHADLCNPLRCNNRREDATRELVRLLRDLEVRQREK